MKLLEVNAQSDHPHPYVLDAAWIEELDLVAVLAADAGTDPLAAPLSNATTWLTNGEEVAGPLVSAELRDVPSPTTIASIGPGNASLLTVTWFDDHLEIGIVSGDRLTHLAATTWVPIAPNPTYVHASWSTTNRVLLSAQDTPGLLLQITGPA